MNEEFVYSSLRWKAHFFLIHQIVESIQPWSDDDDGRFRESGHSSYSISYRDIANFDEDFKS